jgi:signal transduction histidine kinase
MKRGKSTKRALLDLIYRPMRGNDGAVAGILVEGADLTASHAAQDQITTLQNELIHVARVNAMGLLASTLAHELNQPLTAISNFLFAAKMMSQTKSIDPRSSSASRARRRAPCARASSFAGSEISRPKDRARVRM